jgi:proteasome ATPase
VKSPKLEKIHEMLEGSQLSDADEGKLLRSLESDAPALGLVARALARQRRGLRKDLTNAQAQLARVEAAFARLQIEPWFVGTFLRATADGRLDVSAGGRRQIVAIGPDVDAGKLEAGDEVFLTGEGVVVARGETTERAGLVGTVSERVPGGVIVRGQADEELRALCAPALADTLTSGDRVLYARDFPYVFEKLGKSDDSRWVLETPRKVSFDEIGGLDDLVGEIRRDLDLHLLHRDQVEAYQLELMSGLLLVGPPGVGKTLLAAAVASHLAERHPETRFLHVPPGAVRGMFYGEAEARIREIFSVARAAPGMVCLFLDELDSYGARGVGIGQDIDGRVLGALLHELDGLDPLDDVLCIGATNRIDLIDSALMRPGRFGDRVFTVPRPGREATRRILASYLAEELPYAEEGGAAALVEAGAAYLHARRGGAGVVATVTLRNSERQEILPAAVLSGALLASAARRARHAAAHRSLEGGAGLTAADLLAALDQALDAEARKLAAPQAARRLLDIEGADEITLVELPEQRRIRHHRYLRAA